MTAKELDNLKKGDIVRHVWRSGAGVENFLVKLSEPAKKYILMSVDSWLLNGQVIYTYRASDRTFMRLEFGPESVSVSGTEKGLSNTYKTIKRNNFKLKTGIVAGVFTDNPEIRMTKL